ncbi:phosphatidylinositol N-acetylglucosaminyltransferase [Metschnikowia bicuspidata]|uniref:Phosphatidylinositol N-acetylglucosaminyltransferase n=1 Tax=Metschnikowia bicuspidata TaxID=27322 RepID=A0A4P9ZCD5_9ASCO|nr:phosphatidylinositol N-acetylglucosaminyltransferase [Metschnikowia bicuspidata]
MSRSSVRWKKLLYLRQPFPDNYTDTSFLDQLRRNTTVAKYSYLKLVHDFSLVAFYCLLLLLVNVNFSAIYMNLWNPHVPTWLSSFISFILVCLDATFRSRKRSFMLYMIICMLLLVFSPVLRSLTQSTSLDSIWVLLLILTILTAIFHDYSLDLTADYRNITSTNMSFANSIVLASRLPTSMSVFSFLVFSIEVTVFVPIIDFYLRKKLLSGHFVAMITVFVTVAWMIYRVHGPVFLGIYAFGLFGMLVCLPVYFIFLQRYKNELQGPWDTAKPVLKSTP